MKTLTPLFNRTLEQHRQIVGKLNLKKNQRPANVLYQFFPGIIVYRPLYALKDEALPTVLYVPGNAFIASEFAYTNFICSHITEKSRCQVIVIQHALAPEHQFPVGFENVKKTITLLLDGENNPYKLKIDKQRVAIAGYSSGGNFAALMTIEAKKLGIQIARQILISPIADLSRSLKGFEAFEQQDTAISEQFVGWFLSLYIPKNVSHTNPKMSPYWTKKTELQSLPPTDIIFGEFDRFRADAELYGNKLIGSGNILHKEMFKGENHGCLWNNPEVINLIAARLATNLGTEPVPRPRLLTSRNKPVVTVWFFNKRKQNSYNKEPAVTALLLNKRKENQYNNKSQRKIKPH